MNSPFHVPFAAHGLLVGLLAATILCAVTEAQLHEKVFDFGEMRLAEAANVGSEPASSLIQDTFGPRQFPR